MRKVLLFACSACVAVVVASPAAGTNPPTKVTVTQQNVLSDPTACGSYGVQWNISLTADIFTYFDREGRRVRQAVHIREDNTVVNTVTGLTLRDGPVDFWQTTTFNPETGARELIYIVGTSVNVRRGKERLLDKGRLVIDGQTGIILESEGQHPLRELMNGSFDIRLALPGFCDILR
ncbi:MAG: hypothetical protein ACRDNI_09765 [Gaiellaceae bacterium]